ncbi:MAG: hypothetical protein ACFFCW_20545 [Candidatus Hodarchaeota archaeon]
MSDNEKMQRVCKQNPCPICGKPDWCLVAPDDSAAICARIKDGSVKQCGDAGYLHFLVDRPKNQQHRLQQRFAVRTYDRTNRDFTILQQQYICQITNQQLNILSQRLGITVQSLKRLNIGWDGRAYTFPMSNDFGKIIGIRRRFQSGRKVSIKGSKTGLFIPRGLSTDGFLLVCEGATDTAAALDLGFSAIGRPNCNSKVAMTANLVKGRMVVIVGDNDKVGHTGSKRLARILSLFCPSVRIVYPPAGTNDLRQWLKAGLSKEILQELINKIKPIEIRISFKD